jgi:sporulation protein YlmC with PRC-barrel domain
MGGGRGLDDFHMGAEVHSSDGRLVGKLQRLIVDEDGFDPRAIVVQEDARFAGRLLAAGSWYLVDEVSVPVAEVAAVEPDRIELRLTGAEVRRLPPYLTYKYRPVTRAEAVGRYVALATSAPAAPSLQETAHKAAGEIEIDGGENVMLGRTGRVLGHVRDVLVEDRELIGIVMRPAGFFKQDVVLPVRFLDRSDDLALFADLSEDDLQNLRPFQR